MQSLAKGVYKVKEHMFARRKRMKKTINQFINDEQNNSGLLLIDMPTGERVIIVIGAINALISRISGTLNKYISCIA